jgi:hypothetical protein
MVITLLASLKLSHSIKVFCKSKMCDIHGYWPRPSPMNQPYLLVLINKNPIGSSLIRGWFSTILSEYKSSDVERSRIICAMASCSAVS